MESLLHLGLSNAVMAAGLALVAATAAACRCRPALVHALWLLVLLKLMTPPFVSVPLPRLGAAAPAPAPSAPARIVETAELAPLPREGPADAVVWAPREWAEIENVEAPAEPLAVVLAPAEPPVVAAPAAVAESTVLDYWQPALLLIWLGGTATWLAVAGLRVARFARMLRHARPAPAELRTRVARLAYRLGLGRCPEVLLVPGPLSPMLWTLGRPRLLLPAGLLDRLDSDQSATILAHELAHLRRRDHWVRALEMIGTALYWWHPVVWWARRELREAEEQCCDAWVVWALPGAAKAYATALVETIDFLSDARPPLPALASGAGQFPILKRRLTMIMRGTTPRMLSTAGLLAVLALAGTLLPLLPTWAQTEPPKDRIFLKKEVKEFDVVIQKVEPNPAEVERIKNEARKIAEEMERTRDHLRAMEKKFEEVSRKLAELTGGPEVGKRIILIQGNPVPAPPGVEDPIILRLRARGDFVDNKVALEKEIQADEEVLDELRRILINLKDTEAGKATAEALGKVLRIKAAELQAKKAKLEEVIARMKAEPRGQFNVPVPPPESERRLQELERRLADLLREVQGLRQDLRPGARPPVPPTPAPSR